MIGVYGITAIVVATGLTMTLSLLNIDRKHFVACWATIAGLWIAGFALKNVSWTTDTNIEHSVAMLQLNIPQEEKWRHLSEIKHYAYLRK